MRVRSDLSAMPCTKAFPGSGRNVFIKKKKPALSEKLVHRLQKVKYIVLALILLSCITGVYGKLTGTSPWDVFSMITAGRLPNSKYLVGIILLILIMIGMCTQERFFLPVSLPDGSGVCADADFAGSLIPEKS